MTRRRKAPAKGGRRWVQPQLRRVWPRVTTWEELHPTADGVIFRGTDGGVRWDIVVDEREAGVMVVALDLLTRAEFEASGDTLQEAVGAVRTAAQATALRIGSQPFTTGVTTPRRGASSGGSGWHDDHGRQ